MNIAEIIAKELSLSVVSVVSVIELLDEGKTVPFIARYRKERTGSMDDQTIRALAERLEKLRALDKRREEILRTLQEQGTLTSELEKQLLCSSTMTELEDLYLPYRPKRRTRASIAIERGLSPLADFLMLQSVSGETPELAARKFISEDRGVATIEEALQGARDIIAENISNDAAARGQLRNWLSRTATIHSAATSEEDTVYSTYAAYSEPVSKIPDHRILAINRGEREGALRVRLKTDNGLAVQMLERRFVRPGSRSEMQVKAAVADAWERLLFPSLERELRSALTERANQSAIRLFGENLRHLLMQPPIKGRVTLGVDPGYRTGCKLAVVDESGKVLQTGVAHFTLPGMDKKREEARKIISAMIRKHRVTAIAIGNGTASRESEAFIAELLHDFSSDVRYAIVSEAGASVYSASKLGAEEFPNYDVSLRSAISIARRLQDPLAELVKIDPQSIGVGQYQHDLKQADLSRRLDAVVEDCVNAVGVELSTASAALLSHVSGIGPALAKNIVAYREENGLHSRAELKKVPKLGPKAFEQSAGFLRLANSKEPLDATAVHPESYAAAKALTHRLGVSAEMLRSGAPSQIAEAARSYGLSRLAEELSIGEPTLKDILQELAKPGRDPRDELPPTVLRSDVLSIDDLQPGMKLQGTVRNVIDFGAFVDIGVHQDGLIHISRMAKRFVRHPSEVVKVGDVVDVWILEVDKQKKRIALSMVEE